MDAKIKHVYGRTEDAAICYSPQNPTMPDGDDGIVITATIFNAPSLAAALIAANATAFWPKLVSCDFADLGSGKIIKEPKIWNTN